MHVELAEDVNDGLALRELDSAIGTVSEHLDTQEEVNWAQISKLEALLELILDPLSVDGLGSSNEDVVNVGREVLELEHAQMGREEHRGSATAGTDTEVTAEPVASTENGGGMLIFAHKQL